MVDFRLPTSVTRVQPYVKPFGICGRTGTAVGSLQTRRFPKTSLLAIFVHLLNSYWVPYILVKLRSKFQNIICCSLLGLRWETEN
jgi:hypothetical protein